MRHKRALNIPETRVFLPPANLLEMVCIPNLTAPLVDHMPWRTVSAEVGPVVVGQRYYKPARYWSSCSEKISSRIAFESFWNQTSPWNLIKVDEVMSWSNEYNYLHRKPFYCLVWLSRSGSLFFKRVVRIQCHMLNASKKQIVILVERFVDTRSLCRPLRKLH